MTSSTTERFADEKVIVNDFRDTAISFYRDSESMMEKAKERFPLDYEKLRKVHPCIYFLHGNLVERLSNMNFEPKTARRRSEYFSEDEDDSDSDLSDDEKQSFYSGCFSLAERIPRTERNCEKLQSWVDSLICLVNSDKGTFSAEFKAWYTGDLQSLTESLLAKFEKVKLLSAANEKLYLGDYIRRTNKANDWKRYLKVAGSRDEMHHGYIE